MNSRTNIMLVRLVTVCINGSNAVVKILKLVKNSKGGSIAKLVDLVAEKARKVVVVTLHADPPKVHAKASKVKCTKRKVLNASIGRRNENLHGIFQREFQGR